MSATVAHLLKLPEELLVLVGSLISNKEIKQLRLASRECRDHFILRIERVYISPNATNLEVFSAILEHPQYRPQIKQIIWDDALLEEFVPQEERFNYEEAFRPHTSGDFECFLDDYLEQCFPEGPKQFAAAKKWFMTGQRLEEDTAGSLTIQENLDIYRRLYEDQTRIIQEKADVLAFRRGLAEFPVLQRITLTSEAHRPAVHRPCHITPMIQSLPINFMYPCPWPWNARGGGGDGSWHGMSVVLDELVRSKRTLPEFVVENKYEAAGIAQRFFDGISQDSRNFDQLVTSGALRRLDLALDVERGENNMSDALNFVPFARLRNVLSKAVSMEHFSLSASTGPRHTDNMIEFDGACEILKAIPIRHWSSLRHLGLSSVPVRLEHFLKFLSRLPPTIQSLVFVDVQFRDFWNEDHDNMDPVEEDAEDQRVTELDRAIDRSIRDFQSDRWVANWDVVLEVCREHFGFQAHQPEFSVGQCCDDVDSEHASDDGEVDIDPGHPAPYRRKWVKDEIAAFFDGGLNPFVGEKDPAFIQETFGVIRDDFDDSYEKRNQGFT
jgi:hypothetical protein